MFVWHYNFRLDLARRSAAHRRGLGGVQTSLPGQSRRGSHPHVWLDTRIQQLWEAPTQWSGTQTQWEKETGVGAGQTHRAHPPKTDQLVWGPAVNTVWNSPVGWDWQRFWEEGRRLVWPLYCGTYSSVSWELHAFLSVKTKFSISEISWIKFEERIKHCFQQTIMIVNDFCKCERLFIFITPCDCAAVGYVLFIHALYAVLLYCRCAGRRKTWPWPWSDHEPDKRQR